MLTKIEKCLQKIEKCLQKIEKCLQKLKSAYKKLKSVYKNHTFCRNGAPCTLAWLFSCKFAAYFQSTFPRNFSRWLLLQIVGLPP